MLITSTLVVLIPIIIQFKGVANYLKICTYGNSGRNGNVNSRKKLIEIGNENVPFGKSGSLTDE